MKGLGGGVQGSRENIGILIEMAKKIWIFGLDFGPFPGVPGPRDPHQDLRLIFLHRMDRFSALEVGF